MVTPKTKSSDLIYDSGAGCSVPKLERDETIPVITKVAGATWTVVHTVNGQEKRLKNGLDSLDIPTYLPVIKDKSGKATPIFCGCIFATLTAV